MMYTTHSKLQYTIEIEELMENHTVPLISTVLSRETDVPVEYNFLQSTGTWFEQLKTITVPLHIDLIKQSFSYELVDDELVDGAEVLEIVTLHNSSNPSYQFESYTFYYIYNEEDEELVRTGLEYSNFDENREVSCKYFNFPSFYTYTNNITTYGYHFFRRQIGHSSSDGTTFVLSSNGLTRMMTDFKMIPWNLTYEELKQLRIKFDS